MPGRVESIRQVLRSTLLESTQDFSKMSKDQLKDARQMYQDVISMNKSKGRPIKQYYLDNLSSIEALLSGKPSGQGVTSDPSVFGHPQQTSHPKYRNLVPVKVKTKAQVQKFIDKAQKSYDSIMTKWSKEEAIALGRIKATPTRRAKAKRAIKSRDWIDLKSYAELIRDETMKELQRLYKLAG